MDPENVESDTKRVKIPEACAVDRDREKHA